MIMLCVRCVVSWVRDITCWHALWILSHLSVCSQTNSDTWMHLDPQVSSCSSNFFEMMFCWWRSRSVFCAGFDDSSVAQKPRTIPWRSHNMNQPMICIKLAGYSMSMTRHQMGGDVMVNHQAWRLQLDFSIFARHVRFLEKELGLSDTKWLRAWKGPKNFFCWLRTMVYPLNPIIPWWLSLSSSDFRAICDWSPKKQRGKGIIVLRHYSKTSQDRALEWWWSGMMRDFFLWNSPNMS